MDSSKIKVIIIAVLATFASIYLGITAATAQVETIAWVLGVSLVVGCFLMGQSIWLLIPLTAALGVGLRIPGSPSALLLAQALVIGFLTLQLLMRKLPFQMKWTELEFWVLVLALFVGQAYARNPVGLNIFGGSTVGGKPYAMFLITLISSFLLAGLKVPDRHLRLIFPLSIIGGLLNLCIGITGRLIPTVGYYTGQSYASAEEMNRDNLNTVVDEGATSRIGDADTLGKNLSLWISSVISPIRACFKLQWFILVLLSIGAAMIGGFRNGVIAVGFTYIVGIAYRNGFQGVILATIGGSTMILLLAVINLIAPLPPNVQRSLTFLPGTWEQRYKDDTKGSTDWRVEMWKEALLTDRWIYNKLLGDGLGFKAEDFQKALTLTERDARSGFDIHREQALINGDYHSGPVSTIRTIGYLGLLVFLLAQIRLSVRAHRQIKRCEGTEWYPLALFLGIPLVWGPVFFVFVFGAFGNNIATYLMSYSMIRLIENNLPLPPYRPKSRSPYILKKVAP